MPTIHSDEDSSALPADPHLRRSRGEDSVPAPGHSAATVPDDYHEINGWGADIDPADRPSFPKELPSEVTTLRGDVGARQEPDVRVHVSNEHPDLTPVFGTSCPPKGLSGLLRDYAYEYGEGTNRHWLTLMLADRVDVIESMITGVLQGHPDHYVQEKAWATKLRHSDGSFTDRKYLLLGAAVVGVAGTALLLRGMGGSR